MGIITNFAKGHVPVLDGVPVHIQWHHSNPLVTSRRGLDIAEISGSTWATHKSEWVKPEPRILGIPFMRNETTRELTGGDADALAERVRAGVLRLAESGIESNGVGATRRLQLDVGMPGNTTWQGVFDLDRLPAPVQDVFAGSTSLYGALKHLPKPDLPTSPNSLVLF
jgi:hypothetical protein